MSNVISFVGTLGKDSVMKTVGTHAVIEFNAANNTGYGDKKITNWFKCSYWVKPDSKMAEMLLKGQKVFIIGELNIREWEKEGKKGTSVEVRVNNLDFVGSASAEGKIPAPKTAAVSVDEDTPF